ncbi:MAG: hypothetical protein AB7I27_03505 [Bacteriovoracaceae bacterium]
MIAYWLILLLIPFESQSACLSDSQVNMEASTTKMRMAEETAENFQQSIGHEIPAPNQLTINLEPLNPRVNAEINKTNTSVAISIWGGMLSHPRMNNDTLILLLCHELGHFLGGPPLKSRTSWSSTEGQADYFSGLNCAHKLGMDEAAFLSASLALTKIYAEVSNEPEPSLESCDRNVASRTNYGYPKVQCRLDTLIAGWRGEKRPSCWFSN